MLKLLHNALISHTNKVMLKILQARLQQYMNHELQDVQAGFRKGRRTEIKWPTSIGSWKKQGSSRKTSTSALSTTPKLLSVWITTNCGKLTILDSILKSRDITLPTKFFLVKAMVFPVVVYRCESWT